ncbi:MAG: 16S rRNA (uracil(1498)-N(3))-methyltransferase [Proteobacteria bacterium]|nr:16S rRNA (uracil(1498)-N(3))-methyltransferase [Pseudomonadota bacterium]
MPQFFLDRKLVAGERTQIRGADARHITQSLRLRPGDQLVLSDGRGRSFRARIEGAGSGCVSVAVVEELQRTESAPAPVLAIASIRPERMEWAVEKAVELGCSRVIPFDSARTVRRAAAGSGPRRHARLSRIATEAAKQSGLTFLPVVESAITFEKLCASLGSFDRAILFHESEERLALRHALSGGGPSPGHGPIVIIGPEGGFTDDEVSLARSSGAAIASLGQQILRAETAAVVAIAICQYESGNMDAC